MMAGELGFTGLLRNSVNTVGDRDFVTYFLRIAPQSSALYLLMHTVRAQV